MEIGDESLLPNENQKVATCAVGAKQIGGLMQAQLPKHLLLSESLASESDETDDDQSHLHQVLQCSILPGAVNLGRPKDSTRVPMTPDQLRQFAQNLRTNTHVTLLNLSYQSIGPDVLLELVGPLALLTSLRELHLAGANTLMPSCLCGNMPSDLL